MVVQFYSAIVYVYDTYRALKKQKTDVSQKL